LQIEVFFTHPQAELAYNIALCCFKTKQYAASLKHLADIIEKGMREHPELSVGRCGGVLYMIQYMSVMCIERGGILSLAMF
jgi:hypothetical protein